MNRLDLAEQVSLEGGQGNCRSVSEALAQVWSSTHLDGSRAGASMPSEFAPANSLLAQIEGDDKVIKLRPGGVDKNLLFRRSTESGGSRSETYEEPGSWPLELSSAPPVEPVRKSQPSEAELRKARERMEDPAYNLLSPTQKLIESLRT